MATWTPTPAEIDFAGDCLLDAIRACARHEGRIPPKIGDLAIGVFTNDWESVGYVIEAGSDFREPVERPWLLWTTGRRLVRWWNTDFFRVGPSGLRIPNLKYPTAEEIAASRLELERP